MQVQDRRYYVIQCADEYIADQTNTRVFLWIDITIMVYPLVTMDHNWKPLVWRGSGRYLVKYFTKVVLDTMKLQKFDVNPVKSANRDRCFFESRWRAKLSAWKKSCEFKREREKENSTSFCISNESNESSESPESRYSSWHYHCTRYEMEKADRERREGERPREVRKIRTIEEKPVVL